MNRISMDPSLISSLREMAQLETQLDAEADVGIDEDCYGTLFAYRQLRDDVIGECFPVLALMARAGLLSVYAGVDEMRPLMKAPYDSLQICVKEVWTHTEGIILAGDHVHPLMGGQPLDSAVIQQHSPEDS